MSYLFGTPGPLWFFFALLLVLLFAFLIVRVVFWTLRMRRWRERQASYRGGGGPRGDGALAIARRRYARGEITREQYDQLLRDLQRPPP